MHEILCRLKTEEHMTCFRYNSIHTQIEFCFFFYYWEPLYICNGKARREKGQLWFFCYPVTEFPSVPESVSRTHNRIKKCSYVKLSLVPWQRNKDKWLSWFPHFGLSCDKNTPISISCVIENRRLLHFVGIHEVMIITEV